MCGGSYGLSDTLKYHEFQFDSDQAINSFAENVYTSDWPLFYLGKPLNNIAGLKVLEVQIPFSYYVFNHLNNTFILNESDGGGNRIVTIPPGNYSSSTILTTLAAALNAASANSHTYTVTYDNATQKLTITSNAGGTNTFTFTFGNDIQDPGWTNPRIWLGFSGGSVTSSTSQSLTAPFVVQLTGPNYVYVNSVTLGAMIKLFLPANYSTGALLAADGPQCARIPITSQPSGVTFWQDPGFFYFIKKQIFVKKFLDPQKWFDVENWSNMAQVDFYLTLGDNPAVLELNGNEFAIKLGVLTNEASHNDFVGGGRSNDRVQLRTGPVSMRF